MKAHTDVFFFYSIHQMALTSATKPSTKMWSTLVFHIEQKKNRAFRQHISAKIPRLK